jgi:hypothetical protein
VLYDTMASVEGRSEEDFATRRVEHAIASVGRQTAMGPPAVFAALNALLREELTAA